MGAGYFHTKRHLGQHFLKSQRLARKIVEVARIDGKVVIEIGAGKGILTREIAPRARRLVAVEFDQELAQYLQGLKLQNTEVINKDFLKFEFEQLGRPVIIGNIPYSITTPIIERLVEKRGYFERALLTVQKEYGDRLLAVPSTRQYGSITLFVNYHFEIKKEFTIPARCFSPRPKVNSMVLSFFQKNPPFQLNNEEQFFEFIQGLFCYRRKLLKNAIRNYSGIVPEELEFSILKKRPENLTIDEFYRIFQSLYKLR